MLERLVLIVGTVVDMGCHIGYREDDIEEEATGSDMNLANRLTRPGIKTSPKDHLDLVLGGNLDLLLIKKQEYLYKEAATINYGLLIDKSG